MATGVDSESSRCELTGRHILVPNAWWRKIVEEVLLPGESSEVPISSSQIFRLRTRAGEQVWSFEAYFDERRRFQERKGHLRVYRIRIAGS